jgi:hypothetical protein
VYCWYEFALGVEREAVVGKEASHEVYEGMRKWVGGLIDSSEYEFVSTSQTKLLIVLVTLAGLAPWTDSVARRSCFTVESISVACCKNCFKDIIVLLSYAPTCNPLLPVIQHPKNQKHQCGRLIPDTAII